MQMSKSKLILIPCVVSFIALMVIAVVFLWADFLAQNPRIANNYYLYEVDLERWLSKKNPTTGEITKVVDSVVFDIHRSDPYILAIRQPQSTVKDSNDITRYKYSKDCEYWIVNTNTDDVFGPLQKIRFFEQLIEIGICADCKLEDFFTNALGKPSFSVPDHCLIDRD